MFWKSIASVLGGIQFYSDYDSSKIGLLTGYIFKAKQDLKQQNPDRK